MTNIITPYLIDIDSDFEEMLNTIMLVAGFNKKIQKQRQLNNEFNLRNQAKKAITNISNTMSSITKEINQAYYQLSNLYPSNKTFREVATGRFTSHRIVIDNINDIKFDTSKKLISTVPYNNLNKINTDQLVEADLLINEYAIRFNSLESIRGKLKNTEDILEMRVSEQKKYTKLEQKLESELKIVEKDLKRMRSAAAIRIIRMIERETVY